MDRQRSWVARAVDEDVRIFKSERTTPLIRATCLQARVPALTMPGNGLLVHTGSKYTRPGNLEKSSRKLSGNPVGSCREPEKNPIKNHAANVGPRFLDCDHDFVPLDSRLAAFRRTLSLVLPLHRKEMFGGESGHTCAEEAAHNERSKSGIGQSRRVVQETVPAERFRYLPFLDGLRLSPYCWSSARTTWGPFQRASGFTWRGGRGWTSFLSSVVFSLPVY